MGTDRNILFACALNLAFAVFEFIGGLLVGSTAIVSDAVHDLADAAGIGASYLLEKKSKKCPDAVYTFGYGRYSVLGGMVITLSLLVGSAAVLCNAVAGLFRPIHIDRDGMLLFAVVGICVNSAAVFVTHKDGSVNQKAVNLHMLEDVLGWAVVLVGAVVIRATGFERLDPIMSICLAVFMIVKAGKDLNGMLAVVLEKTPDGVDIHALRQQLLLLGPVVDVYHFHVWSIDGRTNCATMHLIIDGDIADAKKSVREKLKELGLDHVTLETETAGEIHCKKECMLGDTAPHLHHHCHHHHG